jgi:competence protein ComEC
LFEKKLKLVWIILGILVGLNIFAFRIVYDLNKHRELRVVFLDVGQGDSIFIETPSKQQILIDGGPGTVVLEKLAEEMPFYDRTLDLIVLTHPEHDHMSGLIEVLKRYDVENILWTGVVRDTSDCEEWQKAIKAEQASIFIAEQGLKIKIKNGYIDILSPFEILAGENIKDSNETSIMARLVFGKNSFLFTGDTGFETENKLIEKNIYLDSDILKVGHHGSKYSTSANFLSLVSPDIAVIQVGKNSYGHPSNEVLARLENFGINIFRNDINKNIEIVSNGNNFVIKTNNN